MDLCVRCGNPVDDYGVVNDDQGYAYCEGCERDYQRDLASRWPYGQCQECGAEYRPVVCRFGKQHEVAMHAEGVCRNWRDVPDWPPEMFGSTGYCEYGCKPRPRAVALVAPLSLDDLPF